MLTAVFFGDYKKVRTRYKIEKRGFDPIYETGKSASCAGCSGDCGH